MKKMIGKRKEEVKCKIKMGEDNTREKQMEREVREEGKAREKSRMLSLKMIQ
jgi:hypothetical protein